MLYFDFATASEHDWERVYEFLSPMAFINPHIFNYKFDYGIWCIRNGIKRDVIQNFYNCYILEIVRLEDDLFSFMTIVNRNGQELLASFDFDLSLFEDFMKQVPKDMKDKVRNAIRKSPFKYVSNNESESFKLSFSAYLSDNVIKNENEHYLPLNIKEFF